MRVCKYRVKRMYIEPAKNGIWTYRRRVESGLEEPYNRVTGNKQPFFKRSLKTRDKREAERMAPAYDLEYEALMQKLRHQAHLSDDDIRKAHLSLRVGGVLRSRQAKLDAEVIGSIKKDIDKELARYKLKIKAGDDLHELETVKYGKQHKKQMTLGEYYDHLLNASRVLHVYERMFTEPGLDVSQELSATRRALQESQLNLGELFLDRLQNHTIANSQVLAKQTLHKGAAPKISEAVERWKEKNSPSENSYSEWKYTVRRFIELHGDLRVDTVEDSHIVEFRDAISLIPSRLSAKHNAMTLSKLIELARKGEFKDKPPRSPNTVRKMVVGLSTILGAMEDDGFIVRNPAKKKAPKSNDDGSKRPPYEFDELEQLFASEYYKRDFWHSPARHKPSRFWSPLIALYTGCRAGEIAALRVKDVRQEEGVWYLSINVESGKGVKTSSAVRDIAIHKDLIKMGFIRYMKQQRKADEQQLFPDISPTRKKPAGYISNNYSRYVEKLGLKKDGKSFHSFRDNFSDACVNSGMDDRTTDRLLGHAMQGAKKYYGKGLWLTTSKKLVDKLYKGKLDLSHLYVQ